MQPPKGSGSGSAAAAGKPPSKPTAAAGAPGGGKLSGKNAGDLAAVAGEPRSAVQGADAAPGSGGEGGAAGDAAGANRQRQFPKIKPSERCGECKHCLNLGWHKPCLTARWAGIAYCGWVQSMANVGMCAVAVLCGSWDGQQLGCRRGFVTAARLTALSCALVMPIQQPCSWLISRFLAARSTQHASCVPAATKQQLSQGLTVLPWTGLACPAAGSVCRRAGRRISQPPHRQAQPAQPLPPPQQQQSRPLRRPGPPPARPRPSRCRRQPHAPPRSPPRRPAAAAQRRPSRPRPRPATLRSTAGQTPTFCMPRLEPRSICGRHGPALLRLLRRWRRWQRAPPVLLLWGSCLRRRQAAQQQGQPLAGPRESWQPSRRTRPALSRRLGRTAPAPTPTRRPRGYSAC
jgi:hypothetical protein